MIIDDNEGDEVINNELKENNGVLPIVEPVPDQKAGPSGINKAVLSSYIFSLKNYRHCRDLNPGPPRYKADMLPIELSRIG